MGNGVQKGQNSRRFLACMTFVYYLYMVFVYYGSIVNNRPKNGNDDEIKLAVARYGPVPLASEARDTGPYI